MGRARVCQSRVRVCPAAAHGVGLVSRVGREAEHRRLERRLLHRRVELRRHERRRALRLLLLGERRDRRTDLARGAALDLGRVSQPHDRHLADRRGACQRDDGGRAGLALKLVIGDQVADCAVEHLVERLGIGRELERLALLDLPQRHHHEVSSPRRRRRVAGAERHRRQRHRRRCLLRASHSGTRHRGTATQQHARRVHANHGPCGVEGEAGDARREEQRGVAERLLPEHCDGVRSNLLLDLVGPKLLGLRREG